MPTPSLVTLLRLLAYGKDGDKMIMILEISVESGCLHVVAKGKFSLEEAKRTFIEILEAVVLNKVGKVLLDGRRLAGNPKFMERFYYGKFAAETVMEFADQGVSSLTKFAYVLEIPMLDAGRFGENVARSRGMNIKVFDTYEDALGWLRIPLVSN